MSMLSLPPADSVTVQGSALGWLQLFQLISANLPVGSFTYSQGLEWAVEAGWVKGAAGFEAC